MVPIIRRRSEEGDTLIEVLLALVVLGLASVALLVGFGTVISGSAEHRTLSNQNLALEAGAQRIASDIQSSTSPNYLVDACQIGSPAYTFYPDYNSGNGLSEAEGGKTYQVIYAQSPYTPIQYWNGTSYSSMCTAASSGSPQLITIQIVGSTKVLTFVVGNPSSSSSTTSGLGNESLQIVNYAGATTQGTALSVGNAGAYFSTQPYVEVADGSSVAVTTDLSPVVFIVTPVGSATGSLSNCSGLEVGGYVTFSECTISSAGTYTIYAHDLNPLIGNSPTYYITVGAAGYHLSFTRPGSTSSGSCSLSGSASGQPVGGVSGAALATQPAVWVENSSNQQQCGWTGTITLAASGGSLTTDAAANSTCLSLAATNGYAAPASGGCDFAGAYTLVSEATYLATQYELIASVPNPPTTSVASIDSNAFGVSNYGAATQLVYYAQPIGVASSTPSTTFATQSVTIPFISTVTAQAVVAVEDSFGNVVANAMNGTHTMGLGFSMTGGGTEAGCTQGTLTSGYYPITGCHGSAYSSTVQLIATSNISVTVNGVSTTPSTTSSNFSITGVPTKLIFSTQPVAGASGSIFTTMPVLEVEDSGSNTGENGSLVVTAATGGTFTLTSSPSTGPLAGTLANCTNLTLVSGIVSVQNCTFAGNDATQPFPYTLTGTVSFMIGATSYGPFSATSSTFEPTSSGAATQLVFVTSPVAGVAGSAFTTMPVIYVEDSAGNLVTSSNAVITLASSGGTLANCANLAATGGVVNVSDCTFGGLVGNSGTMTNPYTLTASSTGFPNVTSAAFYVTGPGPVSQLVVNLNTPSPCSPSIVFGTTCTATATYEDAYGNTATTDNAPIAFQNTGSNGGAVTATAPSQSNGVASETLTATGIGNMSVGATGDVYTATGATFTITPAPQSVSFYAGAGGTGSVVTTGTTTYGAGNYQVYAQGSQGGAITFSTSSAACTVGATSGVVTLVSAGTCSISAVAGAVGNYAASPSTTFTLTINKAPQSVHFYTAANGGGSITTGNTVNYSNGGTYQTYAQGSQGGAVTFATTTGTICTVNVNSGLITILTGGSCVITADAAATTNYADSGTTNFTLTINKVNQTINFTSTNPPRDRVGGPSYSPTANSTSGLAVTISLDSTSTGCALNAGAVTFTGNGGTCVIDANQAGNASYNAAAQVQQTITVVNLSLVSLVTAGATGNTVTTSNIYSNTPVNGSTIVIFISFTSGLATGNTCGTPTSTAFTGAATEIGTPYQFYGVAGGPWDYLCEYTAISNGTKAAVTETDTATAASGGPPAVTIQVMNVAGDNAAVVTNSTTNSSGNVSSTTPVFNLGATPGATSLEFAFGAAQFTNGGTAPTWTTPTNFAVLSTQSSPNTGYPPITGEIFDGPATATTNDTLSATSRWGTIGLEIQP